MIDFSEIPKRNMKLPSLLLHAKIPSKNDLSYAHTLSALVGGPVAIEFDFDEDEEVMRPLRGAVIILPKSEDWYQLCTCGARCDCDTLLQWPHGGAYIPAKLLMEIDCSDDDGT